MPRPNLPPAAIQVAGNKFRELRLARGMTREQVAELSGAGYSTVFDFEKGHNIELNTLTRLAAAIGARVKINITLLDRPMRVAYRKRYLVLRDAQRPVPKTLEGVRKRAESTARSPQKRVRHMIYP